MSDEQSKPGAPGTTTGTSAGTTSGTTSAPSAAGGTTPATGERMELPTWNRGRTKRRGGPEAQEDAFQAGVKEVGREAAKRGPLVGIGVVVALAAVVAGIVLYARSQQASASATRLLAEAAAYESRALVGDPELLRNSTSPVVKDEAARAAAVDKALGELSAQAAGTQAELDGILLGAARLMREGKAAEAQAAYRKFLDGAAAGHPLRWAAREGLAFAVEAQGDLDGALAEFKALAGEKGVFYRDMGLWHQGRVLERQGKTDEALAIYRQYIAEYPLDDPSLAQSEVRGRLEELDPSAVVNPGPESALQILDAPPGATPGAAP